MRAAQKNSQNNNHPFNKKIGLLVLLVVTVIAVLSLTHVFYDADSDRMVYGIRGTDRPGYYHVNQNSSSQNYFPNGGPVDDYAGNAGFTQNGITVLQPLPNTTVSLPLNVLGFGLPPFEGVPGYYQILDAGGKLILQHNFSPANLGLRQPYGFLAIVNNFTLPAGSKGNFTLRIHNDNESGLAQNDRMVDLTLKLLK